MNFLFRTLSRITLMSGRNGAERVRTNQLWDSSVLTNSLTQYSNIAQLASVKARRTVEISLERYLYGPRQTPAYPVISRQWSARPAQFCLGYKICMWKHGNVPPWQPSASFSMLSNVVEPHNYFCLKFGSSRPASTTRSELPRSRRRPGGLKMHKLNKTFQIKLRVILLL